MGVVKLADYRPQLEVVEHRVADTEDGFMRVANEITDSLLMADLTVRQMSSLQERRLRMPMRRILDIMHRSELGKPLPDDFTFEFNPLWQMSDVDRSTVAVNTTNAISTALGDGLMTRKAAMTDLRENSDVTGIGASITDEDIENAEDEAPPGIGELGDKPPESPGGDPISNEPTADSAGGRGYRKWALRWFK